MLALRNEFHGVGESLEQVRFICQDSVIIAASESHLHAWTVSDDKLIGSIVVNQMQPTVVAAPNDWCVLVRGSEADSLETVDVSTWKRGSSRLAGEIENVLAVSPDGTAVAGNFDYDRIVICDVRGRNTSTELKGHEGYVHCTAFIPGRDALVSASNSMLEMFLWDTMTSSIVRRFENDYCVREVAVSSDGEWLVASSENIDEPFLLWDLKRPSQPKVLLGSDTDGHGVAISPDAKYIAGTDNRNEVFVWRLGELTPLCCAGSADVNGVDRYHSVAFSADSSTVVACNSNGMISTWSIK